MAGRRVDVGTEGTEVALVAATVKTVLEVVAPANIAIQIKGWGISFDGVSVTAEPVQIALAVKSVAATASAVTERDLDIDHSGTIQTVGTVNATVEGTITFSYEARNVHPQQGFEIWYPQGEEKKIEPTGIVGLRATAPAAVNCEGFIRVIE